MKRFIAFFVALLSLSLSFASASLAQSKADSAKADSLNKIAANWHYIAARHYMVLKAMNDVQVQFIELDTLKNVNHQKVSKWVIGLDKLLKDIEKSAIAAGAKGREIGAQADLLKEPAIVEQDTTSSNPPRCEHEHHEGLLSSVIPLLKYNVDDVSVELGSLEHLSDLFFVNLEFSGKMFEFYNGSNPKPRWMKSSARPDSNERAKIENTLNKLPKDGKDFLSQYGLDVVPQNDVE